MHTYAELWHASDCVLATGLMQPKGATWQFLSSILLTAFALEAYLNHVGPRVFECWPQLESLSPLAKLELICEKQKISLDVSKRPRSTLTELIRFRNTLAHGKTATIVAPAKTLTSAKAVDDYLGNRPLSDWETKARGPEFAQRARSDLERILNMIHSCLPEPKEKLFAFGIGEGSAVAV